MLRLAYANAGCILCSFDVHVTVIPCYDYAFMLCLVNMAHDACARCFLYKLVLVVWSWWDTQNLRNRMDTGMDAGMDTCPKDWEISRHRKWQ